MAEQRGGIFEAAQQRGDGVVAADAAEGEERAEPTRHGQRLVHELGSMRLDAHGVTRASRSDTSQTAATFLASLELPLSIGGCSDVPTRTV